MTRVLAVDVGTSAVKAAVVDDGAPVTVAEVAIPLATPRPGWAEQDPDDWWQATVEAVRTLGANSSPGEGLAGVDVVALTGQMQDLVALDVDGRAVRPAILYSDGRATAEHAQLEAELGDAWARAAGAPPDASNVAAKWRWLARHEPDAIERTASLLLGGHSVVARRLTGRSVCDPTTAATTGLFDVAGRSWWAPVVDAIDAPVPDVVAATSVTGELVSSAAAELGLPAGIPVVHANGDAVATTVGVIGRDLDRPYAYLGTSGWVATGVASPADVSGVVLLPGLDDQHWVGATPMPTAGAAIDWARRTLFVDDVRETGAGDRDDLAALDRIAGEACAAEHGVLFLPHLDGARFPVATPEATGVLVGVRRSTDRATVAAAVFEGVAHAVRQLLDVVASGGDELAVCGGAARSPVLRQAVADVTGRRVMLLPADHATVLGAATAATIALGGSPSAVAPLGDPVDPRPERHAVHRRSASSFDDLLPTMSPLLTRLVEIRSADDGTDPAVRPGA